jgi:hypothetical protein
MLVTATWKKCVFLGCTQGRDADGSKQRWTAVTSALFAEELLKDRPLHADSQFNPQYAG